MKKSILAIILLITLASCQTTKLIPGEECVKYFVVTEQIIDPAVSEITYLDNGCIQYLSLNYGEPDTMVVCGDLVIVKKDSAQTVKQFVRKMNR
jgi:hypothetical protein